ncbi:MAG: TIGR03862 family flavoprotein, partial [Pseudomonadota bacterium]
RAWLGRLADHGVQVALRWRWRGWEREELVFDTPQGRQTLNPRATVLALGGASWSRLGSDGAWVADFPGQTNPFAPTNMGLHLAWSAPLKALAGTPLKSVGLRILDRSVIGECVISETGLEGSAIYALSKQAREALAGGAARLMVDLAPNRTQERLVEALSRPRGKQSWGSYLRKAARLDAPKRALLYEAGPLPSEPQALAHRIKALPLEFMGTAPLEEAISVAGGLRWDQVSETLALRDRPEIFVAGEMLDWEAPTGGYLITGCLATGRWAGASAAEALGLLPK